MNDDLLLRCASVALYKGVINSASNLIELLAAKSDGEKVCAAAGVFADVTAADCRSTGEWLNKLVESDDNVFASKAARGERIDAALKAQAEKELLTFKQLSLIRPDDFVSDRTISFFPMFKFGGFSATADKLISFYLSNGSGVLSKSGTFIFTGGELRPVPTAAVNLSDLKNYSEEKSEIVKNTENFINGLPAFNTLLYGDRGTGKSTTVRALAYEYRDRLKVIELSRAELNTLPELYKAVGGLKQRVIVFIDDLSFDENDDCVDAFKAALEGSLSACDNVLLYCTSNRRHLIKEVDRDVKNRNDETQAELALFDRFGLVVTYINPDKAEYLDIFKQILRSRGIKWREEYAQIAELAALKKGGRSPRAAKQIADLIEATYATEKKRGDNG